VERTFELSPAELTSEFNDIDSDNPDQWWYARYASFALNAGIIEQSSVFRPDDPVSCFELQDMVEKTIEYMNRADDQKTAS